MPQCAQDRCRRPAEPGADSCARHAPQPVCAEPGCERSGWKVGRDGRCPSHDATRRKLDDAGRRLDAVGKWMTWWISPPALIVVAAVLLGGPGVFLLPVAAVWLLVGVGVGISRLSGR